MFPSIFKTIGALRNFNNSPSKSDPAELSTGASYSSRQPTILIAGNFRIGTTESGLAQGFRQHGWVVHELDSRIYFASGPTLPERALKRLTNRARIESYNKAILSSCCHLRPHILFTVKGSYISEEVFNAAQELGIKTVCLWSDRDFDRPGTDLNTILSTDFFLTSASFQLSWLLSKRPKNTAFIAKGYVPAAHNPILREVKESDYITDISYIGNHSTYKQQWIEGLHRDLPDAKLRVIGNRWAQALPQNLAEELVESPNYLAANYSLAIQTARINIAVHWGKAANGWEDFVSSRTFEIPASGGFMLHIDNDEVREYYKIGEEIDVFSSSEELSDKCRFYLANPDIRQKMARKAYERCVPAYSYTSRAAEILELFKKHRFLEQVI